MKIWRGPRDPRLNLTKWGKTFSHYTAAVTFSSFLRKIIGEDTMHVQASINVYSRAFTRWTRNWWCFFTTVNPSEEFTRGTDAKIF